MADKFWVGQRVIWKTCNGDFTATVLSQREPREYLLSGRIHRVYRLDVDGHGERAPNRMLYAAPQRELRPIYDGDQHGSWEEVERLCGWSPAKVIERAGRD
jgi:hypothetical protein